MCKVSAIVSAYYAEKYIESRLANLFNQFPPPEIIVIAQKGSKEAEIAKAHDDIIWILTEDIPTIYAAWNIGIRAANGEYITNANCDDSIYAGTYAAMALHLDMNDHIALVYGDNDLQMGSSTRLHKRMEGGYDVLKKYCFVGPFPMWRRSLHDKYGLFDERYKICGDYEYWLRIARAGEKFDHFSWPVGLYLKRADSLEHRNQSIATSEAKRIRRLYE
jgi:glycosyltransferase involved in cell wall biosynthesis